MNFVLLQSEIISYINTLYNKNKYCELGREERGANTKPIKGKFTTKVLVGYTYITTLVLRDRS